MTKKAVDVQFIDPSPEHRIYVVVPARVTVRRNLLEQPAGRQIAQACHVVSKLRLDYAQRQHAFCQSHLWTTPVTTIILQARDQKEMMHGYILLVEKNFLPTLFADENPDVYGDTKPITAMAVLATPKFVEGILDYLPLWGAQ